MKIALVQMFCEWGNPKGNLNRISGYCEQAKQESAALAAFPETTVTGIFKDKKVWDIQESLDGPSVKAVCETAKSNGLYIGCGFTEKAEPLPYNAYFITNPNGEILGVYRKNYISPLEKPYWQGHKDRPVIEIEGKKFGIAICFDNRHSELLDHYGKAGVDAVLMPHAWDSDPIDKQGKELKYDSMQELVSIKEKGNFGGWKSYQQMKAHFMTYIPQAAKKNNFHALFINQAGQPHECIKFMGPTFHIDNKGAVRAEVRDEKEQLLLVDI
jgi:predicted amidohydrolase